jgi:hypothetical protein
MAHREEVATFTFLGVTERIIIGQEEGGSWQMLYLRPNGYVQARIGQARDRQEIMQLTKRFMDGHGKALVQNLIQSSEIFLGTLPGN